MRNEDFCYWLQGYFEICQRPLLNQRKIKLIRAALDRIHESRGAFTQWLHTLLADLSVEDNNALIDFFCEEIQLELNQLFHHVIDNHDEALTEHNIKQYAA